MHDIIGGRYRLDERIGTGGMAEVWRATDVQSGETVAIKRLHSHVAPDAAARARFEREVSAARTVRHPAAVRLLDAGEDETGPWLAMEHVAGGSLADRLGDGAVPASAVRLIGADVASALTAVHGAGLVHRDVTPSNILLPPEGGARLGDFGIARAWDAGAAADVTRTGDLVGTLRFVAPEVLAGAPASPAADVWALGAVLFESLTGTPPFDASSPAALLASQRTPPGPPPGIDEATGRLVSLMLDPEPAVRPSATAVAASLGGPGSVDGDAATVVVPAEVIAAATAVPSRAAAGATAGVSLGGAALPPSHVPVPVAASPEPASRVPAAGRVPTRARRIGSAPLLVTAALLVLAAVVLSGAARDSGGGTAGSSWTPSAVVDATSTPEPTSTAASGAGAGAGPKDGAKHADKKDNGKGKGNGKGSERGGTGGG